MGRRIGAVKQGAHTYGRIHLDQWFTRPEDASRLVADLFSEMPELRGKRFIEPSAGAGAFVDALLAEDQEVEHYDLEPNYPETVQRDWLLEDTDCEDAVVIGNPPYGWHNKLSKDFTIRAFEQGASHVAFLVPLGFMRTALIKTGRRVEYFKIIDCDFVDLDGRTLGSGGQGVMAWVVLSAEKLNETIDYYRAADHERADTFWLAGDRYFREDLEKVEGYYKTGTKGAFKGSSNGRARVGIAAVAMLAHPVVCDALSIIAKKSGNTRHPPIEVTNFWLSNPELYRGEI